MKYYVVTLNTTFDQKLLLADEGYESGSDTFDLPTLLRKHEESTMFLALNMLCSIWNQSHHKTHHKTPPRPGCRWLSFSSTDDYNTHASTPHTPRATPASTPEYSEDEEEEEDFQMVPLNNDHWTSEEIPERTLCIHEHS